MNPKLITTWDGLIDAILEGESFNVDYGSNNKIGCDVFLSDLRQRWNYDSFQQIIQNRPFPSNLILKAANEGPTHIVGGYKGIINVSVVNKNKDAVHFLKK